MTVSRRITRTPLDLNALLEETSGVDAGAVVMFGGTVRRHDGGEELAALEYDAHEAMAEERIQQIEREIREREGVLACRIVHRWGRVAAGEPSVWVVVRGRHRPEAFEAARDAIDMVKSRAPIWKEDVTVEGDRRPHPIERGTRLRPEAEAGDSPASSPRDSPPVA
jgi:molybdopterin synthase catalytic subunit